MPMKLPETDESQLNMTPMIDIVFQLIVFFLLTLKFKAVDRRIESALPKDRGIQATQQFVSEMPMVTVKLFRQNMDDPDNAWTTVRVGNNYTFELPKGGYTGVEAEDNERRKQYEDTFTQIRGAISDMWGKMGRSSEAKGEIKTPRPKGLKVPHGDVIYVLDSFIQVGIEDVKFEGAPAPLPTVGAGGAVTAGG
jgi:hypothetical protein